MLYKYSFSNDSEKEQLIQANSDKFLIEEQNITEGNFLVFSDEPPQENIIYINVPKEEFDLMKQALDDLILNGGV